MSTVTITRAERDLIRHLVGYWLPGVGDFNALSFGTRAEATEAIRKLRQGVATFDELGWSEDDKRSTFMVTGFPELVEILCEARDDAAKQLPLTREHRARAHNGDRDHWFVGYETLDAVLAQYDREIAMYAEEHRVSDALLERLGIETVTA